MDNDFKLVDSRAIKMVHSKVCFSSSRCLLFLHYQSFESWCICESVNMKISTWEDAVSPIRCCVNHILEQPFEFLFTHFKPKAKRVYWFRLIHANFFSANLSVLRRLYIVSLCSTSYIQRAQNQCSPSLVVWFWHMFKNSSIYFFLNFRIFIIGVRLYCWVNFNHLNAVFSKLWCCKVYE